MASGSTTQTQNPHLDYTTMHFSERPTDPEGASVNRGSSKCTHGPCLSSSPATHVEGKPHRGVANSARVDWLLSAMWKSSQQEMERGQEGGVSTKGAFSREASLSRTKRT